MGDFEHNFWTGLLMTTILYLAGTAVPSAFESGDTFTILYALFALFVNSIAFIFSIKRV